MYRLVHNPDMSSIRNMSDVYNFRTEEFTLGLDFVEPLLPTYVDSYFSPQLKGLGIYYSDDINPRIVLSSKDEFLLKTDRDFKKVTVEELTNQTQNLYLKSNNLVVGKTTTVNLSYYFGKKLRFSRSTTALRKILSIKLIASFLQLLELYSFSDNTKLQSISSLLCNELMSIEGLISFYRHHSLNGNVPTFSLVEEKGIERCWFEILAKNFKVVFKELEFFIDKHRDNFYFLELKSEKLSLVRGIDHKYLPYYEQKFREVTPELNPFMFTEL